MTDDTTAADDQSTDDSTAQSDTFPREYVEQLRAEAAEHGVRAKRANEGTARLLAATVREATAGIFADATDLPADGDYPDEDGWPDPDRITSAARGLVDRKAHLADRRPRGRRQPGRTSHGRDRQPGRYAPQPRQLEPGGPASLPLLFSASEPGPRFGEVP